MDGLSDAQLLERFTEHDELRYFEALVNRHVGKVRAMIYPMVLNDSDADDLTQDVFLRVAAGVPRFRRKAQFSTWLYRITMNTVYSFIRRKKRQPFLEQEDPPEPRDVAPDPSLRLAWKEVGGTVAKALESLSPPLRAAITLVAIHGMSPGEAAKIEGCLPATLYWRVHEARRILKKKLGAIAAL